MNCPTCDKPMVVLEIGGVEVDHCVKCRGTWLDAGELELLLEGVENRDRLLSSMTNVVDSPEVRRRCPICSKKMDKVVVGSVETVMIDKCARGDGLWFDEGELRQVVAMGEAAGGRRVYELLGEVFAHRRADTGLKEE